MIATPSNPTGTSLETTELKQICDFAAGRDAWRIVDEIYLNLGTPPATSVLSVDPDAS